MLASVFERPNASLRNAAEVYMDSSPCNRLGSGETKSQSSDEEAKRDEEEERGRPTPRDRRRRLLYESREVV